MTTNAFVYIVDDSADVRDSLQWLLQSVDLESRTYPSAHAFFENCPSDAAGCIVMDLRMPGLSGLGALKKLSDYGITMPLIMISAHGSIETAVQALQQGAVTFLEKPFDDQKLLDYIYAALEQDKQNRIDHQETLSIKQKYQSLTKREKQVFFYIAQGLSNQETADVLGVNRKTVEGHRANLIQKLELESLAQLVQLAIRLQII